MPPPTKAANGGSKEVAGPCHETCLSESILNESAPGSWGQDLKAGPLVALATCPLR